MLNRLDSDPEAPVYKADLFKSKLYAHDYASVGFQVVWLKDIVKREYKHLELSCTVLPAVRSMKVYVN